MKTFIGREEQLSQIAAFFQNDTKRPRMLVLHALGGQGKTQIALEYCHQARGTYSGIFWINSNSVPTATQSMVELAQELDPSATLMLTDDTAKVAFVRRTLEQWQERWLMVFDNCDNPDIFSHVEQLIPQGMSFPESDEVDANLFRW